MIDWSSCPVIERDPQRASGAWTFRGTRVPVAALFQNLADGASLADFLAGFPGVAGEQARCVLEHVSRSLDVAPPRRFTREQIDAWIAEDETDRDSNFRRPGL